MKKKFLVVAGVAALLLAAALLLITNGLAEGAALRIDGIDLSGVPDGIYTGTHDFKRWSNTLLVTVEDHAITSIEIAKDVFAAQVTHCSQEVFDRVIGAQNTTIDVVSGATVTSKAYLASIENALM